MFQSQTLLQQQQQQLTLKRLFQIALDVDRLMRRSKVLSLQGLEAILFERFNVNCLWVPADVTLTMVGLLYENHSTEKQSKLTTSEVKKLDRYREMGKVATNWIIWLLQDCRFEVGAFNMGKWTAAAVVVLVVVVVVVVVLS